MNTRLHLLFVAPLVAAFTACGVAPTDSSGRQLTVEDAGPPPENPLAVVQAALHDRLKDPDSAQVRILGEPKAMVTKAVIGMTNGGAGWRICSEVNAKNVYGGYTGYHRVFLLWSRGVVIEYLDDDLGDIACRNA